MKKEKYCLQNLPTDIKDFLKLGNYGTLIDPQSRESKIPHNYIYALNDYIHHLKNEIENNEYVREDPEFVGILKSRIRIIKEFLQEDYKGNFTP